VDLKLGQPELYLERANVPTGTFLLQHTVLWDPDTRKVVWEQYLVMRPGFQKPGAAARGQKQVALARLGRPPQKSQLTVSRIEAGDLTAADAALLRESFAAALQTDPAAEASWRAWAQQTLANPGLDAEIRRALEEISRPRG
jgi:hypothetical protein